MMGILTSVSTGLYQSCLIQSVSATFSPEKFFLEGNFFPQFFLSSSFFLSLFLYLPLCFSLSLFVLTIPKMNLNLNYLQMSPSITYGINFAISQERLSNSCLKMFKDETESQLLDENYLRLDFYPLNLHSWDFSILEIFLTSQL